MIIIFCTVYVYNNDSLRFKLEYEYYNYATYSNGKKIIVDIEKNNTVDIISVKSAIEIFENKSGIIYFGYPSCPWCRNIVEILTNLGIENDEVIYYVDVQHVDTESKDKLFDILDDYLETNEAGDKKLYVPDVYFVKDGEIIGHHLSTVESYKNPYLGMNDEQKKELYNIYFEYYKEMRNIDE